MCPQPLLQVKIDEMAAIKQMLSFFAIALLSIVLGLLLFRCGVFGNAFQGYFFIVSILITLYVANHSSQIITLISPLNIHQHIITRSESVSLGNAIEEVGMHFCHTQFEQMDRVDCFRSRCLGLPINLACGLLARV
jgi:hypothetical protein